MDEPASPLFVRGVALPPLHDGFFIDHASSANPDTATSESAASPLTASTAMPVHALPSYMVLSSRISLVDDEELDALYDANQREIDHPRPSEHLVHHNSTSTTSTTSSGGSRSSSSNIAQQSIDEAACRPLTASTFAPFVEHRIEQAYSKIAAATREIDSEPLTQSQEMLLRVEVGDFHEMKRKLVLMIEQYADDSSLCSRLIALNDRIDDTLAFYSLLDLDHDYDDDDDSEDDRLHEDQAASELQHDEARGADDDLASSNSLALSNFFGLYQQAQEEEQQHQDQHDGARATEESNLMSSSGSLGSGGAPSRLPPLPERDPTTTTITCAICEDDGVSEWLRFSCGHSFCTQV